MRVIYAVGALHVLTSGAMIARPDLFTAIPGLPAENGSGTWFEQAKPFCNTVEVEAFHSAYPAPTDLYGRAFSAACYALAGRIADARDIIQSLPAEDQYKAAGVVFNVVHPVADMGDDEASGPIMALVVEFWPNHYQALYHAGMAQYATGHLDSAQTYLTEFLQYYHMEDGWTSNARTVLERLASR